MSIEQDVAAAREAVDALEQACNLVTRHYRQSVDSRRLRVDVARLREDLTLLCGARSAPVHGRLSTAGVWNDAFEDAPLVARPGVQ
jgi:hypothetical protein